MSAVLPRERSSPVLTARRILRTFYETLQGPYTSVILTDAAGVPSVVRVSQRLALSISAVYRAIGIYADLIGTMPVRAYRGDTDRIDLPPFVTRPHGPEIGWTEEIGQTVWSVLLRGNAYLVPTRYLQGSGYPETFAVLDPDAMQVDGLDYRYRVNGTEIRWSNPGPLELLHVRWMRPPGANLGVGILDAQGYPGGTLAGAAAANYFASELMANPNPPAVLTHPMRLNQAQAEALQTQWSTSVARSRSIPAVLSGGISFTPITISARDAQLIETRARNATEIAVLFGLPPYLLGGSTGDSLTYATVEGEMLRLWTTALMPMAVRIERALSAWLPHGSRIRFVPDSILRSQTLDRYRAHEIALKTGIETLDEVRALENLPPLPSGAAPIPVAEPPAITEAEDENE